MQLTPDTLLQGRYRIVGLIAQGGMGAVYKAIDERLGNSVALKQALVADPQLRAAFEREARLLAGLHHPALPVVSDHFSEGGGQYLVMQFIPGEDLGTLLRRRGGPFGLAEVTPWADRLLDALDYLHTRRPPIVHRDVKPLNLKLTERGELILLDFGLAKGEPAGATAVNPSLFGYTPQYAPIEQIQGSGTNARSDLYSVGATLYELLTGSQAPDALTRASAAVQGAPDPLRPAHELNPQLPPALSEVLSQALTLNPAMRPPSAAAMRAALHAASRGQKTSVAPTPQPVVSSAGQATVRIAKRANAPQTPQPTPLVAPHTGPFARNQLLVAGGVTIFLVLLAAVMIGILFSSANRPAAPRPGEGVISAGSGSDPIAAGDLPRPSPQPNTGGLGTSRQDPLPPGTPAAIPGWKVEVLEVIRGEAANDRVARANSNNDVPGDDEEYVLLRVRAVSTANEEQYAFSQSDVAVVGSRDVAYRGYGAVAPAPRLESSGQILPGEAVEGWAAYMVGKDEDALLAIIGDPLYGAYQMVSLSPGASVSPDREVPEVEPNAAGVDPREPAGLNEPVITDEWEVRLTELISGDEAWARIRENYSGSDPPAQGMQYILARVEARYIGDGDEAKLIADSYFTAVSGDEEIDQQVVLVPPPELFGVLFPGGRTAGWIVMMVPTDSSTGRLVFRGSPISTGNRDDWRYFALD